jgi:hypothetical protein
MSAMRRLDELQADRALWGLEPEEAWELDRLLRQHGEEPDETWERTAAAATVAMMQAMPGSPRPQLLERLREAAASLKPTARPGN